ncbi:unnamed protein product [Schistocephalus solidus]|uniref:Lysophospholipid acyltransferase 7 n=1 Tax=Schistocephalus solidus TaxID=70667 RepID=A0A183T2D4_SCHSO|nr:unnamed protein product [Schistocephalus solidus]
MPWEDLIYALFLLISLLTGFLVQKGNRDLRRNICIGVGITLSVVVCGTDVWHSFVLALGFILFVALISPRYLHYVTFIWGFAYLGFFHYVQYFGFSKPSPFSKIYHLFLTLRVVGVAFELHDTWKTAYTLKKLKNDNSEEYENLQLRLKYKAVFASPVDLLCYLYSYIGMLTGPYYSYRTFNDMLTGWPTNAPRVSLDPFYRRLQEAPFFGVAYFFSSHFFSISHVRSPDFYDHGFIYRFGYMMIIFFVYRMRIYFAWLMAECACMTAGLGAYPALSKPQVGEGPTDLRTLDDWMKNLEPDSPDEQTKEESIDLDSVSVDLQELEPLDDFYTFDTVRTVSVWQCEFSPSIREGMKAWNMTVQHWLSKTIYSRCPGPRMFRSFVTMLTSAFWHGLEPGYYLAFLPMPFAILAEDGIATAVVFFFGCSLPPGTVSLLRWLFKMRIFEYFAMAFLLLDAPSILTYWASLNYLMHFLIAGLVLLHLLLFKFVSPLALKTVLHPRGPPKLRASYKIHKLVEDEEEEVEEEEASKANDWMSTNSYGNSVGTRHSDNMNPHYL